MADNKTKKGTPIDPHLTQDNQFIKLTGTGEADIMKNAKAAKKNLGKEK